MQLNQEIFQKESLSNNQNALEILEYIENDDLKAQLQAKDTTIWKETVENAAQIPIATIIAPGMFNIDLEPLAPRSLKNREAHIDYLKHTQEQADILQGIVEQAKAKQLLDNALDFAFKKVSFFKPLTSSSNIQQVESSKTPDSNTPVFSSTGLKCSTSTCRSQPIGNKRNDRILQTPSSNIKNKVEVQRRRVKSKSNKKNRVKDPICDTNVKHTMLNSNSELTYVQCNQCMFDANHDVCFLDFVNNVNVRSKSKFTPKKIVHLKETTSNLVETPKPDIKVYRCSIFFFSCQQLEPNHLWGSNATNVPSSSSLVNDKLSRLSSGTIRFKNDQVAKIIGYGDYQLGNVIISRVYYIKGLGHNLFSVGQFCDADLEVAFRKNTCFIRNLEVVDLLSGSRDTNLYIISLDEMLNTSSIYLLSKASKTKSWLWHRRLSYLNFGTLNKLAKDGLARGIPKLKFHKDHLCSACALGKRKKSSH
ncbi:uncharacterized mitochondrial protein-like protein [Tanacetum coccineum]